MHGDSPFQPSVVTEESDDSDHHADMRDPAAEIGEAALKEESVVEAQIAQFYIDVTEEAANRPGAEIKADQLGNEPRHFWSRHHIAHVDQEHRHGNGKGDGTEDDLLAIGDLIRLVAHQVANRDTDDHTESHPRRKHIEIRRLHRYALAGHGFGNDRKHGPDEND